MIRWPQWVAIGASALLATHLIGLRLLMVSGNSMSPVIRNGDLVVTTKLAGVGSPGSIVLMQRPSDRQLLLHRILVRGDGWSVTKGDASGSPDAETIPDDAVLGGVTLILPLSLLGELPFAAVAAQFSSNPHVDISLTSSSGARAVISGPVLTGADSLGRLLPGGRATWNVTLTPCPIGLGGACAGATNTLRIDPDQFAGLQPAALARSLRLTSTCRVVGTTTWVDAADLFTSMWSAGTPTSGRLATFAAGAGPAECQVQVTLLGSITATTSSLLLPLRWGPE